jgi:acyl-CoA synthetase (NDP forming)
LSAIGELLAPRSVALVGAAAESLWTQSIVNNLRGLGYPGDVHLVHPRHTELFGQPCYRSLLEVPGEVACAYVMTGTSTAPAIIEDCGRKGVRSVVMLTAGFKETGAEGAAAEAAMIERCRQLGITLQGPNCLGFVNYHDRIPAYALTLAPPLVPGGVAVISQSGAMLLHFHRMALQRAIGLAVTVSIGNEAMLRASDFIEELVADPRVSVVGALIEGFRDGPAFLRSARLALDAGKPLVVLKVGGSEPAERAVAAHTGSLAGEDAVVDAVFRQHGVVRVSGLEELIETCAMLAARGWPQGPRTAVISTSGGAAGLIADLARGTRIQMPDFDPEVKKRLTELLPAFGTPQNPLDTTGVIVNQPALLGACVDAVAAGDSYDALLVNSDVPREPGPNPATLEERIRGLAEALTRFPRYSVVASTAAVDLTDFGRELVSRHQLHFANGLTLAVKALGHAVFYGQARGRAGSRGIVRQARPALSLLDGRSGPLSEPETKRVLSAYDITAPAERVVVSAEEAVLAAGELGYPVVLKVVSTDILHKTDAGGVLLGLGSADEVAAGYREMMAAMAVHRPDARLDGVLVGRQVTPLFELIAGVHHDAVFGPVLVCGLGGIFVETLRDVAMRLPPLDRVGALEMLAELRGYPLLTGARSRPAADLEAVAAAFIRLSDLALDLGPRLRSLDLNPLFVMARGEGVLAADALLVLNR